MAVKGRASVAVLGLATGALALAGLTGAAVIPSAHGSAGVHVVAPATTTTAAAPTTVTTTAPTTTTTTPPPPATTVVTRPPTTVSAAPLSPIEETTLNLVDTSRPTVSDGHTISPSRALTTLVWFPAAPGRHPLVMFAHGFQVGPAPYTSLLQSWATRGYVVAAPEFPLTDQDVAGSNLDENDIANQPADLRFVTDFLVGSSSPLASRIDPTRVAVAGHSDGAESALGASVDPVPAGEPPYRALIAMSVQELSGATHTDNPPMLVTQGDADTINPPSAGYQTYNYGASPKYLLVIKGGGHLPPLQAGSAWLPGIEAVTSTFLDCYLASSATLAQVRGSVTNPSLFSLSSG